MSHLPYGKLVDRLEGENAHLKARVADLENAAWQVVNAKVPYPSRYTEEVRALHALLDPTTTPHSVGTVEADESEVQAILDAAPSLDESFARDAAAFQAKHDKSQGAVDAWELAARDAEACAVEYSSLESNEKAEACRRVAMRIRGLGAAQRPSEARTCVYCGAKGETVMALDRPVCVDADGCYRRRAAQRTNEGVKSYALTCDGCGILSPVVHDEDNVIDAATDAGWRAKGTNEDDRDACPSCIDQPPNRHACPAYGKEPCVECPNEARPAVTMSLGDAIEETLAQSIDDYDVCRICRGRDGGGVGHEANCAVVLLTAARDAQRPDNPKTRTTSWGTPEQHIDELVAAIFGVDVDRAKYHAISEAIREAEKLRERARMCRDRKCYAGSTTDNRELRGLCDNLEERAEKAEAMAHDARIHLAAISEALGNTNGDPEVSFEIAREVTDDLDRLAEQAGRVVRSWEDDPTSLSTENAIRELNLRIPYELATVGEGVSPVVQRALARAMGKESSASDGRTQRESVEVTRSLDRGGNERRPSEQGVTAGETALVAVLRRARESLADLSLDVSDIDAALARSRSETAVMTAEQWDEARNELLELLAKDVDGLGQYADDCYNHGGGSMCQKIATLIRAQKVTPTGSEEQ